MPTYSCMAGALFTRILSSSSPNCAHSIGCRRFADHNEWHARRHHQRSSIRPRNAAVTGPSWAPQRRPDLPAGRAGSSERHGGLATASVPRLRRCLKAASSVSMSGWITAIFTSAHRPLGQARVAVVSASRSCRMSRCRAEFALCSVSASSRYPRPPSLTTFATSSLVSWRRRIRSAVRRTTSHQKWLVRRWSSVAAGQASFQFRRGKRRMVMSVPRGPEK